jgi:hypothetical protein
LVIKTRLSICFATWGVRVSASIPNLEKLRGAGVPLLSPVFDPAWAANIVSPVKINDPNNRIASSI